MLRKILVFGVALVVLAPAVYIAFIFALVLWHQHQSWERAEQAALGRFYEKTFTGATAVKLRPKGTATPSSGEPFAMKISLGIPDTEGAGQSARQLLIRAARQGEEECAALLATIASSCRVLDASDAGAKRIGIALEIVAKPSAEGGTFWRGGPQDVLEIDYMDYRSGWSHAGRHELYRRMGGHCLQQAVTVDRCNPVHLRVDSIGFTERDGRKVTRTDISFIFAVQRNFDVDDLIRQQSGRN